MISNSGLDNRVINKKAAADQTVNNSIALVDSELAFTAAANATYQVFAQVYGISAAAADYRFKWSAPAGASGAQIVTEYAGVAYGALADTIIVPQQGTAQLTVASLILINGATAGTVTLQWAQGTADVSDSKILTGSNLVAIRVS